MKITNFLVCFVFIQKLFELYSLCYHPTGDVTRVSVVQRKVTVRIGDAENWWPGCRD